MKQNTSTTKYLAPFRRKREKQDEGELEESRSKSFQVSPRGEKVVNFNGRDELLVPTIGHQTGSGL